MLDLKDRKVGVSQTDLTSRCMSGFVLLAPRADIPLPPNSDIKRGFTGESTALPLTSLQTIATQRVRWFARLAILNIAPRLAEKTLMTNEMLS
ncbi:hypothetical protein AA0313_2328 [Acetobacter indonesiensis NRIC 0313]|uniref:Uncharacterized protein n=1 Tax=Acetobacter indonesiensis TaxID=104101 RepID=A0A6N3T9S3_9PROT|nr:hypothetical protein AA0313_2328 [Acetobacter indonesiensis NRIC 0313]GEN04918.1 hypothetical protein AIN02nite_29430 [Acetobacter indonesiensis]